MNGERYIGQKRVVQGPNGLLQGQGINPATGQWENLYIPTQDNPNLGRLNADGNEFIGLRVGSDEYFGSQIGDAPGWTLSLGTGQEPSSGGGIGGFLNDNATKLAMAGVGAGALGGFSSMMGGAAPAAGGAGGLDAIGQMIQAVPEGMTATTYAQSLGFPTADAWLSTLGAGAGGAAGAAAASGGTEQAMLEAARNQQVGSLANAGINTSTGLGLGSLASGGSALSKILSGEGGASDWMSLLGQAAPGLINAYTSNSAADKMSELAGQSWNAGAPSRERYEASMTAGFDPYTSIAGYGAAVDDASNSQMRALSTQGNPFGNPGGLIEAQKKVIAGTALPAIQNYQDRNATTGGFAALNGAYAGQANAAIGQDGRTAASLGDAFSSVMNPQQKNPWESLGAATMADLLKSYAAKSPNQVSLS